MKIVDTISRMTTLVKMTKKESMTIGFVPTMGYLHEGHMSLVKAARKHTDVVVMSIFVNPLQFGPCEDFEKYPRDLKRDEAAALDAGVDILFSPSAKEMYPEDFATSVNVERLTEGLCGASRPGHFKGVTTVVAKLFNIVRPDVAYFGQKDAQQAIVIRRMAKDLNMDIEIKVLPIVRESDEIAMSSRNAYLSASEREDARVLYQALKHAEHLVARGERDAKRIAAAMEEMIRSKPGARIDYVSIVDAKSLKEMKMLAGEALVAAAVWIGKTRLIDNIVVNPGHAAERPKVVSERRR